MGMTMGGLSKPRLERMHRVLSAAGGWGLAVDIRRDEIYRTPGRFGWDGGLGTSAWTDPAEGMIGILLTQRLMDSPQAPKIFTDFWTLAYAAME